MNNVIELESRDESPNKLIKLEGYDNKNYYTLSTPYSFRMGCLKGDDDNLFIDPSGGPFLCKGVSVGEATVSRIFVKGYDIIIELE